MALLNVGFILFLIVIANIKAVYIEPDQRTLSVVRGSQLVLKCILPQPNQGETFNWNPPLPAGAVIARSTVLGESDQVTMTVPNYIETRVQTFTCKQGTTSAEIKVVPVNETKLEDHFYYGNKTATLACTIQVSGAQTIVSKGWIFQNKTLIEDHRYKITELNLTIEKPNRDDAGPYYAVFEINLPGTPDFVEHRCQVDYTAGPLVMDMARSASAEQGEDLQIYCDVKGYPKAVVTWLRNMKNITRNGTIYSEWQGYKGAHLTIKNIQFSDAGNYTCFAFSEEFQNSSAKHIIIRVKDPLAWLWPLVGILVEIALLAIIIIIFRFFEKRKQAKDLATFNAGPVREKDE